MLVGRDEDLRILNDYYAKAKNAARRNLVRYKIRTIMAESKDRVLQNLRTLLIMHENKGDSIEADRVRNAIRNHQGNNRN